MARPLRLLALLSRFAAAPPSPPASTNSCRLASRGANKAWMGQNHAHRDRMSSGAPTHGEEVSDEELEMEDVEEKLQALVDDGRKRQKTVKYHILRRKMTPPGAPQRKLTWDAIEQIRYLNQEQADEWRVERLAEGFSVSPDVIRRILRSKFVPSPERKAKQNVRVMQALGQPALHVGAGTHQSQPKIPGKPTRAALPPGSGEGAVVPVSERILMAEVSGSLAETVAVERTRLRPGFIKTVPVTGGDAANDRNPTGDMEDEKSRGGWVSIDEEREQFRQMEDLENSVVQVGKDFFDGEGNFLYRI
ncbi:neugrin [Brachionichthys hirsutus]|uniref:neugrin n=1 Tax=Brachionichthys hirsutus TaxID=412623 RepID=UPI0036046246